MISIIQNDEQLEFLSQLKNLKFSITADSCRVTITSYLDAVLYDETLYPYNGEVEIVDMPSIFEADLQKHAIFAALYHVHIEEPDGTEEEFSMRIAKGTADTGPFADFVNTNFLTMPEVPVRVPKDGKVTLSLWEIGKDTLPEGLIRAYYTDKTTADFPLPETTMRTYASTNDTPAACATYEMNMADYQAEGKELYRIVVQADARTMEYLIDSCHVEYSLEMRYRNSFGAWEKFWCYGKVESEPQFTRVGSTRLGEYSNIMTQEVRYWNADTGILQAGEEESTLEMFRSNRVEVATINKNREVVFAPIAITEQECKYDNLDDSLPRYTFKFRLCAKNHNIMRPAVHPQIFTETYTETYE